MAMSATLTLKNGTGETLKVVAFNEINDDASFGGVKLGQEIPNGGSAEFRMSNRSFGLAPQGVGVQATVVNTTATRFITVVLAIPASGSAEFSSHSAQEIRMQHNDPRFGKDYVATLS